MLSTIALREVARGALRLDAPVAAAWHDFGAGGKADLTLAQLLNHQTGLSVTGLPPSARLSQLADLDSMLKVVAGAEARTGDIHAASARVVPTGSPGESVSRDPFLAAATGERPGEISAAAAGAGGIEWRRRRSAFV